MAERRVVSGLSRKSRVTVGGLSLPVSIIISWGFNKALGGDMPVDVTIAVSSVVGALVSVGSLCFWDIRAILMERFRKRRVGERG